MVGKKYPHGDKITPQDANYNKTVAWDQPLLSAKYTTEVGSYPANGYGLYDMTGNVWEWCLDEYDSNFYATFPPNDVVLNPVASPNIVVRLLRKLINMKGNRVLRSGCWNDPEQYVQIAHRIYLSPSHLNGMVGFRCVKDATP